MSRWDAALYPLCAAAREAPIPRWALGSVPPSQGGSLFPGRPGSPGRSGEWEGRPLKSLWFGAGSYLAQQLVGLHGLYLKVAGRLKIEEFRLGRECCCSVSPATPGSGPRPSAAAGCWGRGTAPPTLGPQGCRTASPPPHLHSLPWAWAGREAMRPVHGTRLRGMASSWCPLGLRLRIWPAGAVGYPPPGPAVGPGPPQLAQA